VPELVDLSFIPIVDMLSGAENLHRGEARIPYPLEPHRSQAMPHKQVCG